MNENKIKKVSDNRKPINAMGMRERSVALSEKEVFALLVLSLSFSLFRGIALSVRLRPKTLTMQLISYSSLLFSDHISSYHQTLSPL